MYSLTTSISRQLLFAQHTIMILIQIQILTIDPQGGLSAEPISLQMLLAQLLISQLDQLVKEATGQYFSDLHLTRAQWIQEKEELPHGRAHIKWIKGTLQHLQLRQGGNQLEDIVLQVGLFQVAQASAIVQREADASLMQPELLSHVAKELVYWNAAVCVALEKLGKNNCCEEWPFE